MEKKLYTFTLSKKELEEINQGKHITKVFHNDCLEIRPLLVVVVGKTKISQERVKGILESGDSVAPIALSDEQIKKIGEAEDIVVAKFDRELEICLVSKERFAAEGLKERVCPVREKSLSKNGDFSSQEGN